MMRLDLRESLYDRLLMLKLITLAAWVVGFVFLVPKALAEFRRAGPATRPPGSGDIEENKNTDDTPKPGVAA